MMEDDKMEKCCGNCWHHRKQAGAWVCMNEHAETFALAREYGDDDEKGIKDNDGGNACFHNRDHRMLNCGETRHGYRNGRRTTIGRTD